LSIPYSNSSPGVFEWLRNLSIDFESYCRLVARYSNSMPGGVLEEIRKFSLQNVNEDYILKLLDCRTQIFIHEDLPLSLRLTDDVSSLTNNS